MPGSVQGALPQVSAFMRMIEHVAALLPACGGQNATPLSAHSLALCAAGNAGGHGSSMHIGIATKSLAAHLTCCDIMSLVKGSPVHGAETVTTCAIEST